MRVLIAPDSFKGTLSAQRAAEVIGDALRTFRPDLDIDLLPLADGGEGTADVLVRSLGLGRASSVVRDALGNAIVAHWGRSRDGYPAVIDTASCIGLAHIGAHERDPRRTSSAGAGDLLRSLVDAGELRILAGLGGTATVDGGLGASEALGWLPLDADGHPVRSDLPVPDRLRSVARLLPPETLPHLLLELALDVQSPLLGATGAAAVYGPQKGLRPGDLPRFEDALGHWCDILRRDAAPVRSTSVSPDTPGMGAAGGLAFALVALLGASHSSGAERVLDLTGFDARCRGADLVITGEGTLDASTAHGKLVSVVARRAARLGVPVAALAGRITGHAPDLSARLGLARVIAAAPGDVDALIAIRDAEPLLAAAARRLLEGSTII